MNLRSAILALITVAAAGCVTVPDQEVWRITSAERVARVAPEVLGRPAARTIEGREALCFDGRDDALLLPVNPIEGWPAFTIEALFRPDGDGPEEQRFLHIEDAQGRRVLLETRVSGDGRWALDTFLHASKDDRLTLLDRSITQPTDRWYWVALSHDGTTMRHYVNGALQLEGAVRFPATDSGRISLGVRQNRIHWFAGCLAEVRFTPRALPAVDLRRAPAAAGATR